MEPQHMAVLRTLGAEALASGNGKRPTAASLAGASGAILVSIFFWKIHVTRVNRKFAARALWMPDYAHPRQTNVVIAGLDPRVSGSWEV
jgi:hypothetical protein